MEVYVRGTDERGVYLWYAFKLEGKWWSTGCNPGMLISMHADIDSLIECWLGVMPETYDVQSSWGKHSMPSRVVTNTIAELIVKELGEP